MATTLGDLFRPALRMAGITKRPGITASTDQTGELIPEINRMVGGWNCSALNIFHTRIDIFPLTGATIYTIGAGGNFNIPRPMKIKQAVIVQGNTRLAPMYITTESDEWGRITVQAVSGSIPRFLYNDRNYPLSSLYLWPQDGGGDQIELYTFQSISNSFTAVTDAVSLPDGYEDAIVQNLALRVANLYPLEAKINPLVMRMARMSLAAIQSLNAPIPKMVTDAPGPSRGEDYGATGGGGIIMGGVLATQWYAPISAPNGIATIFTFTFYPREVLYNGLTQVQGTGFIRTGTNSLYFIDDAGSTITPAIGDDLFAR